MDLPPFHHHMYVPPSPSNFSDKSNSYHNQPHRLPPPPLPPLAPPPPPAQAQYFLPHPPAPPPPAPSQSQFTFRPQSLDEKRPRHQFSNFIPSHHLNHKYPYPHPYPHLPSPARVVPHNHHHHDDRKVDLCDEKTRYSDPWSGLPRIPRVPPEPQFRHLNLHRPTSPFRPRNERYSNNFDRSLRFREEFVDEGFRDDVAPELSLWGRKVMDFDGHVDLDENVYDSPNRYNSYELNFDRIDRDFEYADLQSDNIGLPSRDFEFNVENLDLHNNDREEDSRRAYCDHGNSSGYINGNGALVHSHEFSEWNDTVGRIKDHRVGEVTDEFFNKSSRKKQVQKKSALRRIQLGKVNNSRNRSRDHSHFLKGYCDDSSSSGSSSFKGKEKDVSVCTNRKMEDERKKSPVELDVSFKSNALVAKAIKATSSPVVDPKRNSTPRNRKFRKLKFSDSPGVELSKDLIRTESSNGNKFGFDKDHQQLKKVISDKTKWSNDRLASPSARNTDRKESVEKDITIETVCSENGLSVLHGDCNQDQKDSAKRFSIGMESDSHGFDVQSVTNEDLALLVKKTGVSGSDSETCFSRAYVMAENTACKEFPALVPSDQSAKGDACFGGEQSTKKRKINIIPFQHESLLQLGTGACELTNHDNLSEDTPPHVQLAEEVKDSAKRTSSTGTSFVDAAASQSLIDDHIDVKLKNTASGSALVDSYSRKDLVIDSSNHLLLQNAALVSVSTKSGNTDICVGSYHETRLHQDGYIGLNFESPHSVISGNGSPGDGHIHPSHNELMRFANDPDAKVMDSLSECRKEDEIHDGQVDVCGFHTEPCSASSSDGQVFRSESTTVSYVPSRNTCSENSFPSTVNLSSQNETIGESLRPPFFVGSNDIVCSSKMMKTLVYESSPTQDCSRVFSSTSTCFASGFADSLGITTVLTSCLLDDSSKLTHDATTKLPENGPAERLSNAKMIDMGSSINQFIQVHSPRVKRKREAVDDQLGIHIKYTSEIDENRVCNVHDEGGKVKYLEKNPLSMEKEVDSGERGVISRDFSDEGSLEVNLIVGGKKRKVSLPRLASRFLSETSQGCKGMDSYAMSEKDPSKLEELTTESECNIALSCPDEPFLKDFSRPPLVDTAAVEPPPFAIRGDGFAAGPSKLEHVTSCSPRQKADREENVACENYGPGKGNSALLSNSIALCGSVDGAALNTPNDKPSDSGSDASLDRSSLEEVLSYVVSEAQNDNAKPSAIATGNIRDDSELSEKSVPACDNMSYSLNTCSSKSDTKDETVLLGAPSSATAVSPLSRNCVKVNQCPNPSQDKANLSDKQLSTYFPRGFPGKTYMKYLSTGKGSPFNCVPQSRTWHRTGSLPTSVAGSKSNGDRIAPKTFSQKVIGKVQGSYIRKGNSLLRKPSSVDSTSLSSSVYRLSSVVDDIKGREYGNQIVGMNPPSSMPHKGSNSEPERPKTPLIGAVNCTLKPEEATCLPFAALSKKDHLGEAVDHSISLKNMDMKKCSREGLKSSSLNECQTSTNLDCHIAVDERNSDNKIIYVKRKSNQLVAASDCGDLSVKSAEKTQILSSDAYYKICKNQLIRTPVEDEVKQNAMNPLKCLSSQKEAQTSTQNRSSRKKQSGFAMKKFSLVWTLNGTLSSKRDGNFGSSRARPYLFPWKRATYSSSFMQNLCSASDGSTSTISGKLLSRKRDTIYKKSISGFSLRRLKVLSVGGRSLKWSKSIEKNSRKANEDAKLAVVATEKMKIDQRSAALGLYKSRNYVPRERIFRIGSERYRMDPTGKTLQRISDEQTEMNSKKCYVPRRLVIGNDEYVRIGNGNKLVRDPKKRNRVLANEKVRWSLHTARLRLARKKKYCQFFTRFGTCNKDDKKCPYIHDPSKVAVCTKFLNGSCSNHNCKLTHKVIPERMQDCSYFLQGVCSNESCPYRHVNVNPNSPICEGFLRGYCADGDECRKKHTYICPVFEATGNCQQGAKCKLHHPKKREKGMKRKASSMQKNAQGRYFGVRPIDIGNSGTSAISEKHDDDIFCQDGKFADYISLDVGDEARKHVPQLNSEQICDSEEVPSDAQATDLDELIKPIGILKRSLQSDLYPGVDS